MADSENCAKPKNSTLNNLITPVMIGIAALVTGVVAERIASLERQHAKATSSLERQLSTAVASLERQHLATFDRVEEQIADHKGLYGHPEAHSAIARLGEKFPEVEAQFDGDRALSAVQQKANERRLAALELKVFGLGRQGPGQARGAD